MITPKKRRLGLALPCLLTAAVGTPALLQGATFEEASGLVSMEAENFLSSSAQSDGRSWTTATSATGFAGSGYMVTADENFIANPWGDAAALTYDVAFSTPGTYYVWMRRRSFGGASNSAYFDLTSASSAPSFDNSNPSSSWSWVQDNTVNIASAGTVNLDLRNREDGYEVDRIVLTNDSSYNPASVNGGVGPDQTLPSTSSDPVVANSDDFSANPGQTIVLDVLQNDTGSNLSIVSVQPTQYGSVVIENGALTYTANPGYWGAEIPEDFFQYTITDGSTTDSAYVDVGINNTSTAGDTWPSLDLYEIGATGAIIRSVTGSLFDPTLQLGVFGNGIDGTSPGQDEFSIMAHEVLGDFQYTATVNFVSSSDAAEGLGGLMYRESDAANARFVAIAQTHSGQLKFVYRALTGQPVVEQLVSNPLSTSAPRLALSRSGSTYTASISADGISYTTLISAAIPEIADSGIFGVFAANVGNSYTAIEVEDLSALSAGQPDYELTAIDPSLYQNLGKTLAYDAGTLVIGAYDEASLNEPRVIVAERSGSSWVEAATLAPAAPDAITGTRFGSALLVAADRIFVGAPADDSVLNNAGAVYVYAKDGNGDWQQTAKLTANDAAAGDAFGTAIAFENGRLAVSAAENGNAGSVYIFELQTNGSWSETAKVLPTGVVPNDLFGSEVKLHGDQLLVSAPYYSTFDIKRGAVFVFERQSAGSWSALQTISTTAAGASFGEYDEYRFGADFDVENGLLVITEEGSPFSKTALHVYEQQPDGTWASSKVIDTFETLADLGAVDLSGDKILVGASNNFPTNSIGALFVYTKQNGEWAVEQKFYDPAAGSGLALGSAVVITEYEYLGGATGSSFSGGGSGSIYAYTFAQAPAEDGRFLEENGLLVMEAENFAASNQSNGATPWEVATGANVGGGSYVFTQELNNVLTGWNDGPELTFEATIQTSGVYYLWMRRQSVNGANNSAWFNLADATSGLTFDNGMTGSWAWVQDESFVLTEGAVTFSLRSREDGYQVDRIILTTDPSLNPASINGGIGPDESAKGASDEPAPSAFLESGGQLSIEAENFAAADIASGTVGWEVGTSESGFSGAGYVFSQETGGVLTNWSGAARVNYDVLVANPGTYYIWMRRKSVDGINNSAWFNLDSATSANTFDNFTPGDWDWVKDEVVVLSSGLQTLSLRIREDGYSVDKIVLTNDNEYSPAAENGGNGPAESATGTY